MAPFFLESEKMAHASTTPSKTLFELLDAIRASRKLSTAAHWDDGNKIRDGILVRAKDEMLQYASQWSVRPDELDAKTAEMTNAAVYFTGGAQHPPKRVKFDFYYMHCVNCSIFFSVFLQEPWISPANKIRLLEWKARNDLAMYASRRSPEPLMDEIVNYIPLEKGQKGAESWNGIIDRVINHPDDGHAAKLIRALAHAEQICQVAEKREEFRVKGEMWLQLGNMGECGPPGRRADGQCDDEIRTDVGS